MGTTREASICMSLWLSRQQGSNGIGENCNLWSHFFWCLPLFTLYRLLPCLDFWAIPCSKGCIADRQGDNMCQSETQCVGNWLGMKQKLNFNTGWKSYKGECDVTQWPHHSDRWQAAYSNNSRGELLDLHPSYSMCGNVISRRSHPCWFTLIRLVVVGQEWAPRLKSTDETLAGLKIKYT